MIAAQIVLDQDRDIRSFKKKIKVGDKVKAAKAYWIVTKVQKRTFQENDYQVRSGRIIAGTETESYIHLHKVADESGKKMKSAVKRVFLESQIEAIITDTYIIDEITKTNRYISSLYDILAIQN